MKLHVRVQNTVGARAVDESQLEESVRLTVGLAPNLPPTEAAGEQPLGLSIVITDDDHMRRLNSDFSQNSSTTDVLAFPDGTSDPDTGVWYLGDLIISLPQAVSQAAAGGHGVQEELQLLVVHGTLHLLGFDHTDSGSQKQMWHLQEQVLRRLDNPARPPLSG